MSYGQEPLLTVNLLILKPYGLEFIQQLCLSIKNNNSIHPFTSSPLLPTPYSLLLLMSYGQEPLLTVNLLILKPYRLEFIQQLCLSIKNNNSIHPFTSSPLLPTPYSLLLLMSYGQEPLLTVNLLILKPYRLEFIQQLCLSIKNNNSIHPFTSSPLLPTPYSLLPSPDSCECPTDKNLCFLLIY